MNIIYAFCHLGILDTTIQNYIQQRPKRYKKYNPTKIVFVYFSILLGVLCTVQECIDIVESRIRHELLT